MDQLINKHARAAGYVNEDLRKWTSAISTSSRARKWQEGLLCRIFPPFVNHVSYFLLCKEADTQNKRSVSEVIHLVEDVRGLTSAQHRQLQCSNVSLPPGTSLGFLPLSLGCRKCWRSAARHHQSQHLPERLCARAWHDVNGIFCLGTFPLRWMYPVVQPLNPTNSNFKILASELM